MEWLRDWIMQVAGVIVLGAISDMIMTDGAMKKYVKVVIGLVLVFTVIRPVVNVSPSGIDIASPMDSQLRAAEVKNRLGEQEKELVFDIYCEKLQQNIENHVYTKWGCEADADVIVEEEDKTRFGNITSIHLRVKGDEEPDRENIRADLSEKFDVKMKDVKVDVS